MTMREHSDKPIHEIKYAFMGDTRNNMGHSLMIVGCLMGMDVRLCGPKKLWPADEYHPTQMLADVMTMREHSDKPISEIKYAFLGDTRNNMGHSLMIVGCLMGMDVRICGPKKLWPAQEFVNIARELEKKYGAKLTIVDDPKQAVGGVDFIHTDVWVSMGEPKEVWKERIELLLPYQVNAALMKASGNSQIKFMHCLPAFHDTETTLGKQIAETYGVDNGLEVTNDVFESESNLAFEQAENRMHTIKAILVATLGD
jgi:ornithine carbamoyltransferase